MFLIVHQGPLQGLQFELEEGEEEWIIGRDPNEADFVLDDPTLAPRAVQINKTPEGLFFVTRLGPVGVVLVNGRPLTDPLLLSEGDQIQVGNTILRFVASPEEGPYEDLLEAIENPELPPEPEPVEEQAEERAAETIFEEPSEAPFPFLPEPRTPFILKVFSGPNAGAEIGLEKGRSYVIGKDPDSCDIVFNDLSVSRTHARLSISSEGIIDLEDLGSKNGTVVNGSRITERTAITSQHLIQMGTTVFLILDREAPQETIYTPPLFEEHRPATPEEIAPVLEAAEKELEDWKVRKISGKRLILLSALLVALFAFALTFFSLFRSEPIELAHKMPHEHIQEIFKEIPSVHYSFTPSSGMLFLTGHLLTNVEHQELLYHLKQIPTILTIEDAIIIDESVWKMMNELLGSNPNWRSVSIFSSEPGRFVAQGYVANLDQMKALSDFFTVNFPYLDRLQNKVVIEETLANEIVTLLQTQGFGTIAAQFSKGELILSGRYSENKQAAYHQLLARLHLLNGVKVIKDSAIPVHPMIATIDLTQQYKVTGNALQDHKGYSVVINGHILTVDEQLDGMKIISIEPKTIFLEKDGIRYKIDYVQ